jgi:hypothetical protein
MDFALGKAGRAGGRPQRIGGLSYEEVLVTGEQVHRREPPLSQVRTEIVVAKPHRPIIRDRSLDDHARGSGRRGGAPHRSCRCYKVTLL